MGRNLCLSLDLHRFYMTRIYKYRKIINFLRAFYPIQLLFGHLKYNFLALFYWVFLFSVVSDRLGSKFGLSYLFYSPEYRGEISWLSFLLVGFSIGGFIMAFNMYSYMKLGTKYPFLATLSRPFIKFCWNNSLIPIAFSIYYIVRFSYFQLDEEFASVQQVVTYIFAYLVGVVIFIFISILYFFPTNKDFFIFSGKPNFDELQDEPMSSFFHKKVNWTELFRYQKDRTYIYLSGFARLKISRSIRHYDELVLEKVFTHNRINASVFEIVTIAAFIVIGMFRELPLFMLPAGMSMVLLMAVILMLFSIIMSWCNYWTYPVIILVVVGMNYLSSHTPMFKYRSYAFGMDYQHVKPVPYTMDHICAMADDSLISKRSHDNFIELMDNWKKKTGEVKPKLVIVMTSGGGSRSALWTVTVLQQTNILTKGALSNHTQMITGASGGMIGASYYRELMLRQKLGKSVNADDKKYLKNISEDLLNGLSYAAFCNDLFFRYQTLKKGNQFYTKDRGYAFEQQLHQNTGFIMDKSLSNYEKYERDATIPTMIFSPTIVNDGRRMLISSQSVAFMSHASGPANLTSSYENIDFQSFFSGNAANDIRFSSVMRMSATFPFVLPMVSLPTFPEIQLMDAGIRDNYGGKVTMEYLYELKNWIRENTSGVVIVQIRDTKKVLSGENLYNVSLFDKLTLPFGNMYGNFTRTQDFDQDELMKIGFESFSFPIDLLTFNLREAQKDRISLSWHLTSQEKIKIANALYSSDNQESMNRLIKLLERK